MIHAKLMKIDLSLSKLCTENSVNSCLLNGDQNSLITLAVTDRHNTCNLINFDPS